MDITAFPHHDGAEGLDPEQICDLLGDDEDDRDFPARVRRNQFASSACAAALGYADLGYRVIPLGRASKRPLLRQWPRVASTDPDTIVGWFTEYPDANVGILTGNGDLVLDIDPCRGGCESLQALVATHGALPETAEALTGSGGRHLVLRYPPGVRVRNGTNIWPGIDVRGDGGLIVVEPSIHPDTGKEYVWIRTPQQGVADAPSWVIAKVAPNGREPRWEQRISLTRSGDLRELVTDAIRRFPIPRLGTRNDQMYLLTCSLMGRGYNGNQIVEVVLAWWKHHYVRRLSKTAPNRVAIKATIRAIEKSPDFRKAVSLDHRERCRKIALTQDQQAFLARRLIVPGPDGVLTLLPKTHPLFKGVTTGKVLCRTGCEVAFVEAHVVHFTHVLLNTEKVVLQATRDQIREIISERHRIALDNKQFERLKHKYITRPGRPAVHFELAVQTFEGRKEPGRRVGLPSEFRLTGMVDLLSHEAREVWQKRFRESSDPVGELPLAS